MEQKMFYTATNPWLKLYLLHLQYEIIRSAFLQDLNLPEKKTWRNGESSHPFP